MRAGKALAIAAVAAAAGVQARTVALWPIEWDYDNGEYDLRCATTPAYDLTAMKNLTPATENNTLPWNLPPNPDAATFLFSPANYSSLMSSTGNGYLSGSIDPEVLAQHSPYTIEGYVKFTGTGSTSGGSWVVLVHNGSEAFTLLSQLRLVADNNKYYFRVWAANPGRTTLDATFDGPGLTAAELVDGNWHHWAITHLPNDGNGNRVFETFWDGVSSGVKKDAAIVGRQSTGGPLMFGTRGDNTTTIKGGMDYIRISDTVLSSSEFLCAGGGSGTTFTQTTPRTVGYWRLGHDANGGVDGSSAMGGALFGRSYLGTAADSCSLTADPDQAFDGQPPNPTVTIPGGNAGSFVVPYDRNARLVVSGLASHLSASNQDFTVEAYFRPGTHSMSVTGSRVLFSTMDHFANESGWVLALCSNPRTSGDPGRVFRMISHDDGGNLYSHTPIGGEVAGWTGGWKHIALVHHATGGNNGYGYWQLYLDGTLHGSLHDTRQMRDANLGNFILGRTVYLYPAPGKFDCLRVSGTALSPSQFLCATNGTAATDVLAFFPLDRSADGSAYSVIADIAGSYSQGTALDSAYKASAQTDAPTVTNLDSSVGICSFGETAGSVGFGGYGGASSVLYSYDQATLDALNADGASYTIEAYVKHEGGTPSAEQHIFLASDKIRPEKWSTGQTYWPGLQIRITYAQNGFKLSDRYGSAPASGGSGAFQDKEIGVTMTDDIWHHIALVSDIDYNANTTSGTGEWRFYLDGELVYTSDRYNVGKNRALDGMEIGRRHWGGEQPFSGKIAHLRISRAVLDPSDFLNAAAPAGETPTTISYWPLNFRKGVLDIGNAVAPLLPFSSDLATGIDDRAMVRPVHVSVAAEGARNYGSVSLASGVPLVSTNAASSIGNLTHAFTVEGYIKRTGAVSGGRETICGTYRNGHGWKLVLDNTGATPAFRMYGSGRMPVCDFVDASFGNDASVVFGVWRHIALTYDPMGSGVWRLYVNGMFAGMVENAWNPKDVDIRQDTFLLGADASDADGLFAGNFDMWRISTGIRATDTFLYPGVPVPSMVISFH